MNAGEDPGLECFAARAGERLRAGAEGLDARVRSRLTQARHAALAEAGRGSVLRRWLGLAGLARGWQRWVPAGALAASVLVAVLVVATGPGGGRPLAAPVPGEDTELLADADGLALAQESAQEPDTDFDFYAWAVDASAEDAPGAVGS